MNEYMEMFMKDAEDECYREYLYKQFLSEKGIDLTDYEYSGVFPIRENGKWKYIKRGEAWKIYKEWKAARENSERK